QEKAGNTCDIILGMGHDPNLGENISVTIIATGFHHNEIDPNALEKKQAASEKIIVALDDTKAAEVITAQAEVNKTEADPLAPQLVVVNNSETPATTPNNTNNQPVQTTSASLNLELPKVIEEAPEPV